MLVVSGGGLHKSGETGRKGEGDSIRMGRKFPVFLDIEGKQIRVYGGGRIATRRVCTLMEFGPLIEVVAPEVTEELERADKEGRIVWRSGRYQEGEIAKELFMVLAATDDSEVNEKIYRECREKGILVNICSNRNHCMFQFPGVAFKGDLVIGVNGGGEDHHLAKRWTDRIRKEVEKDGERDDC